MGSKKRNHFYAFTIDGRQGIVTSWRECEAIVRGRSARYRGFPTRSEAETWLRNGASYQDKRIEKDNARRELPEEAVYFDAGTGGEHLTRDVAVGLRTPFNTAEELKIKYGHAMPSSMLTDELIEVTSFGNGARQEVSRLHLAEVIEARAEEILSLIVREVKRSGYDGLLAAGLVLCGGTAELAGFKDLAEQMLRLPVRVGTPHDLQGLTDVLESPAYATSVGLLLWGMRHAPVPDVERKPRRPPSVFWPRVREWLRAFLPD